MAYKVYDLQKVIVSLGGSGAKFVLGNGPGKISAERNADKYSMYTGADGTARTVRNNDNTGTVTLTIPAASTDNSLVMALDKSGVTFPIAVMDKTSKGSVVVADGCTLRKVPAFSREAEAGDNEYVFNAEFIEILHAGADEI